MEFWSKDFRPPQSPDLNPLDYSIWWHVESKSFRVRHNSIADLKASVEVQWKNMEEDYISTVYAAFVQAVIAANGG